MRMVGKRSRNGRDGWERAGCMCPPQEGRCATVSLLNTSLVFLFFSIIGFSGTGNVWPPTANFPTLFLFLLRI